LYIPTKQGTLRWFEVRRLCATTSESTFFEMGTTSTDKLTSLRKGMADAEVAAFIVPSSDPHLLEYAPDRFQRRAFISNFHGSAGKSTLSTLLS